MKNVFAIIVALVAVPSFGSVKVLSAIYNGDSGKIEAQISYEGCKPPAFKVQFDDACYETMPPQADAVVLQTAGIDGCERLNYKTLSFSLQGDPCTPYGRHYVNLRGKSDNKSVRISVSR